MFCILKAAPSPASEINAFSDAFCESGMLFKINESTSANQFLVISPKKKVLEFAELAFAAKVT